MTKRQKDPYPALNPGLNLKTRKEEIEVDYLHKLSDEEKAWLNKFNEEYVNATLDRKNFENNIHNTKKLKQACDKRNDERKQCLFTREKAAGNIKYLEDKGVKKSIINNHEDKLIDKLDNEVLLKKDEEN